MLLKRAWTMQRDSVPGYIEKRRKIPRLRLA